MTNTLCFFFVLFKKCGEKIRICRWNICCHIGLTTHQGIYRPSIWQRQSNGYSSSSSYCMSYKRDFLIWIKLRAEYCCRYCMCSKKWKKKKSFWFDHSHHPFLFILNFFMHSRNFILYVYFLTKCGLLCNYIITDSLTLTSFIDMHYAPFHNTSNSFFFLFTQISLIVSPFVRKQGTFLNNIALNIRCWFIVIQDNLHSL